MTREVKRDTNGMIQPVRPRRLSAALLPRGGNQAIAKLRHQLVAAYNDTCIRRRQTDEFYELLLSVLKEAKKFKVEVKEYDEDRQALQDEMNNLITARKVALKQARVLNDTKSPLAQVFEFTDTKELDKWAEGHDIKLDGRNTLDFMQMDFIKQYNEKNKETK